MFFFPRKWLPAPTRWPPPAHPSKPARLPPSSQSGHRVKRRPPFPLRRFFPPLIAKVSPPLATPPHRKLSKGIPAQKPPSSYSRVIAESGWAQPLLGVPLGVLFSVSLCLALERSAFSAPRVLTGSEGLPPLRLNPFPLPRFPSSNIPGFRHIKFPAPLPQPNQGQSVTNWPQLIARSRAPKRINSGQSKSLSPPYCRVEKSTNFRQARPQLRCHAPINSAAPLQCPAPCCHNPHLPRH